MPDTDTSDFSTSDTSLGGILQQKIPAALAESEANRKKVQQAAEALPQKLSDITAKGHAAEAPIEDKLQGLTAEEMRIYQGKPPPTEPTSVVEEWGSPAMIFAALGSLMTRTPMTSALNAGAKVMQAYQSRDADAADKAYKQWKDSNDLALKLNKMQSDAYEKALEKIRTGTQDEKRDAEAELRALSAAFGDQHFRDLIEAQRIEEAVGLRDTLQSAETKMYGAGSKLDVVNKLTNEGFAATKEYETAQKAGDQAGMDAAKKKRDEAEAELRAFLSGKAEPKPAKAPGEGRDASKTVDIFDKDGKVVQHIAAHEMKDKDGWYDSEGKRVEPPPGGKILPSTGRSMNPQQKAFDKFLEENPDATAEDQVHFLQKLRPPRSGPAAAMQRFMEENPNASAAELAAFNAWTRETGTGAVAFGSGPLGNLTRAQNVAIDHMSFLGDDLIPALKNGDQRSINRLTNWAKSEFGYTGPIDFDFAKQIVSQEVNKAIVNVGAGTEGERANLANALSNANSPELLMKVLADAKRLMAGQLRGLEQQYVDVTVPPGDRSNPEAVRSAHESFRQKLFPVTVRELGLDKPPNTPAAPATATPPGQTPASVAPPPDAVEELKQHRDDPVYRKSFDKHFGEGAADKVLGTP